MTIAASKDCSFCGGRGFYGIPGQRCGLCDGTGIFPTPRAPLIPPSSSLYPPAPTDELMALAVAGAFGLPVADIDPAD